VREVPSGGFIAAGYTSNNTPNDTDALAVRFDDDGEILWTYKYNGPSSKEDLFYKVLPTSDGGFIFCGYSRSFGGSDNAFFMKLNSSGVQQWVEDWGGSGIDRAQDIIELPNGKFVICGYTTSSPAQYYDGFILKVSSSGNTDWSKIYGGTSYDDLNSLILLPDDGFLLGGQSNNQLYLIRTDKDGDSLWTRKWGTSGLDVIKCVNFAQGGNGYILAGTTDGLGSGGEDAYLIRTDTAGVPLWSKTHGGNLNDGFHIIDRTSDGGYFGVGSSSEGTWNNPNIWLSKMDGSGNLSWEKFYGGDSHDHGYYGEQTSDGGYIASGHTRSFGDNLEDAMVIKTNSSGNTTNKVTYTTVTALVSPSNTTCGSSNVQVEVEITNFGNETVSSIPVTVEITGAINQTLTKTYNSSVDRDESKTLTFTTTIDMSMGGTFDFHCYTGNSHDVYPDHNFLDKSITVGVTSQPPVITDGSHCGPGIVNLTATSSGPVKWYAGSSGGSSLHTGTTFATPFLSANTTYYAQAGTTCPSARIPVLAEILPGIADPTGTGVSRCGPGSVVLTANSVYTVQWFDSATSLTILGSGPTYTTPSLSLNSTYYIQAVHAGCNSNRIPVQVEINPLPPVPTVTPGTRCGSGSVMLSASSPIFLKWFDSPTGGHQVGSGSIYNTSYLTSTKTFYVLSDDGICQSALVPVLATIAQNPSSPITVSSDRCGSGTLVLYASANSSIKWFDALTGGNQVGSGNSLLTPPLSSSATFYAMAVNGTCVSNRIPANAIILIPPQDPATVFDFRCGPGTLVLTAFAADPVEWYDSLSGGNLIGTGYTFNTPVVSNTTNFYAQANNGQCISNRISTQALVHPLPVLNSWPDTIYSSASNYLLDAGAGFQTYFWAPSFVSQTFTAHVSGSYCVTVSDSNNCQETECVFVNLPLGISDQINKQEFLLYPDPSNGLITIEFPGNYSEKSINIFNVSGKVVYSEIVNSDKGFLDLTKFSPGIYFIRFYDGSFFATQKFIIH
jgi:hypothetical protein